MSARGLGQLCVLAVSLLTPTLALGQSPRTSALELKLGGYYPLVDRGSLGAAAPYATYFGRNPLLLFELELDRQFWQRFGSLGVGFSVGYGEKYGRARVAGESSELASEAVGFHVIPFKLLAVYRFDYAAQRWNVPLVPYAKGGLAYTSWWATKGTRIEEFGGRRAAGGKWGYAGVLGMSFLLDFLEPRLARDFDSDLGVNHSYLFAEYVFQEVNDFRSGGLDLSSRHWMFGLMLEY